MYGAQPDTHGGAVPGPNGAPPLWAPHYGASFGAAVKRFFKKYADFGGRASRSEYWWMALFFAIVYLGLGLPAFALGVPGSTTDASGQWEPGPGYYPFAVVLVIFMFAVIVPSIALGVRRLHDVNMSGLAYLLCLIPYIGALILTILALLPSRPEGARFDRVPGGAGAGPVGPYASSGPYGPGGPPAQGAPDSTYGYGHQPGGSDGYPPPPPR